MKRFSLVGLLIVFVLLAGVVSSVNAEGDVPKPVACSVSKPKIEVGACNSSGQRDLTVTAKYDLTSNYYRATLYLNDVSVATKLGPGKGTLSYTLQNAAPGSYTAKVVREQFSYGKWKVVQTLTTKQNVDACPYQACQVGNTETFYGEWSAWSVDPSDSSKEIRTRTVTVKDKYNQQVCSETTETESRNITPTPSTPTPPTPTPPTPTPSTPTPPTPTPPTPTPSTPTPPTPTPQVPTPTPQPTKTPVDLKAVCEENSCEGARREDVPEDGQCIAMVTGAEQCRPAEGGGCEAPVGSTYLVVACMNKSTRIVANNQVYNTNNVNDNVQGKYSLTYIRMWPHYHKWYWVTDDAPDNLTYKEFIQNVSKWGIPSTAGGDYHGPACSIPVLYTLKDEKLGEIIKMEIGQNDVEAAYFMVDRYWLLDKTDTNYDKTFRYALAWFVKDPNNQAGHLMSLPSKPEWLP